MFISTCTQTHLQGTGWGGHLLAFSKALIKGMAEHTEGMGKERKKNNDSWGLAKAECRYHKFMSARFEALPRQCDAKWLVLLPRVFVPVYLRAQCCCFSVCMHPCVIFERVPPPTFHLYSEGWTLADYVSALACVRRIQNLGGTVKILKINSLSICCIGREGLKTLYLIIYLKLIHYLFYTMNGLTYCDITQYKHRKF